MGEPTGTLSAILDAVNCGERGAEERLFRLVYDELRRMAHGRMAREKPGNTLQTTALVNEAYLRLMDGADARWENRRHFFGAAANAMRRILVDRYRRRVADKRGGSKSEVPLDENLAGDEPSVDLIALDEALTALSATMPRPAEVVKLRYFLGLTVHDTANLLDVSPRTVDGDWRMARAWLRRRMTASTLRAPNGESDGR